MAVHHKYPRKLYSKLSDDLVPYGCSGKAGFGSRFDLAREMRKEQDTNSEFYKSLAEVSHINKKRISQIARMVGDNAEPWEIAAIRDGMKLLKKKRHEAQ